MNTGSTPQSTAFWEKLTYSQAVTVLHPFYLCVTLLSEFTSSASINSLTNVVSLHLWQLASTSTAQSKSQLCDLELLGFAIPKGSFRNVRFCQRSTLGCTTSFIIALMRPQSKWQHYSVWISPWQYSRWHTFWKAPINMHNNINCFAHSMNNIVAMALYINICVQGSYLSKSLWSQTVEEGLTC